MDWFLYSRSFRHERVKHNKCKTDFDSKTYEHLKKTRIHAYFMQYLLSPNLEYFVSYTGNKFSEGSPLVRSINS